MTAPPPTIVGLHYWAGSGGAFAGLLPHLGPFPLLAPDLSGFGDEPPAADLCVDAYADRAAAYVQAQGLRRYVLLGHSMGGKIALALAARRPAGLAGVALLCPSPPGPEPMTDEDRRASLLAHGQPADAEKTFRKITAVPLAAATHRQIVADNLRTSPEAWAAWLRHGSLEDVSSRMGRVQAPCLVLTGDADRVLPPAVHQVHTLPLLPRGTALHVLAGVGHLLPYEAPHEVGQRLQAFCQRL